ncbi:AAA family ATPase [Prolixibacteraceae bacterium JC049]|nr:AAA family ATPase [Prolixibacteraceae bacterium JC049]
MFKLFESEPEKAGYRLQYMELYNWGTFHEEPIRISPECNNSLLTGGNGSGKTTYVDALLTLLVPERKYRFYNQSSNTKKKHERTEESYVLGAFGEKQIEGKQKSTTEFLRPDKKNTNSFILACFVNSNGYKPVTVFQTRHFSGGALKRNYGIARVQLSIKEDFLFFDAKGDWKRALKKKYPSEGLKENISFFDSARKYANKIIDTFGMRSIKALSLFNQTVGIKVLGDLDEFIRLNMLENQNTEEDFQNVKESFSTLLRAQNQIEKATEQVKQLTPIKNANEELLLTKQKHTAQVLLKDVCRFYFAQKEFDFISFEKEVSEDKLELKKSEFEALKETISELDEQKVNLRSAIDNSDVGQELKTINSRISGLSKQKDKCETKSKKYNSLAEKINLITNPDKNAFEDNFEKAKNEKGGILNEQNSLADQEYQARKIQEDAEEKREILVNEVQILREQKTKIPSSIQRIRDDIVNAVGALADEIPFIGELIKVKESEISWEQAIEKLLHNFALRIIVPEKYYEKVNKYVNSTNLQGIIIYHKVITSPSLNSFHSRESDSLIEKIDFKKSIYRDWIEEQFLSVYNYVCIEDVKNFNSYSKAITKQGLIKNNSRHQKDDRVKTNTKANYVLGWDNKDKIKAISLEVKELGVIVDEKSRERKSINKRNKKLEEKKGNIIKFTEIKDLSEIDWQIISKEIQVLIERKDELESTNEKLKELESQLKIIVDELKRQNNQKDELLKEISSLEQKVKSLQGKINEKQILISSIPTEFNINEKYSGFEDSFKNNLSDLDYGNLPDKQKYIIESIEQEISQLKDDKFKQREFISNSISSFLNPKKEILEKYPDWESDTDKLPSNSDYVDEYITLLDKIQKDGLPSYRVKFNNYLTEQMINKIAGFKEKLDEGCEAIEDNIEALNGALQKIKFRINPDSYIQLQKPKKIDKEIDAFRLMLKEAIPDAARLHAEDSENYKLYIFEKIKNLINELSDSDNERWKDKVIDVRNWFSYYAEEFDFENNRSLKVYKGTDTLSGGEKPQLSYTILASAIAYQFGIKNEGASSHSFRFIAVDESFSNQDDEKAEFLMNLCKQLHLQLLVVTPLDKIHIVQNHISNVHYVKRVNNRESVLFNMPILEYIENREKYK